VVRAGIPDEFVTHGSIGELNRMCGLDIPGLAKQMQSALNKRTSPDKIEREKIYK
jgi:1-deoxy-D-xylulose-5-phosphate synthase